jgi:hypothetical protein
MLLGAVLLHYVCLELLHVFFKKNLFKDVLNFYFYLYQYIKVIKNTKNIF